MSEYTGLEIAVVGLAGRFPGAPDVNTFWRNLCAGVESIRFFSDADLLAAGIEPEALAHPRFVKARGVLEAIEWFDAAFFGFTPREAETLDPQQRLFLECVWQALENAGYDVSTYPDAIGLYGGAHLSTYLLSNLVGNPRYMDGGQSAQTILGNDKDFLTTRVSYKLNLRGPSVNVSTACSTSLVAVHLACQALVSGACDLALAGGVTVNVPHLDGYFYQEGGILSPDGHCRAFDARAAGTVSGNGVGVVVLKRLEDALAGTDHILAIIKGTAINNDGAQKVGYTAPSVEGQARVLRAAQAVAGITPDTLAYIETHGTGTALGDPVEIAALTQAFHTEAGAPAATDCALGSVKTNIGHLDAAAGIAGLIKTVLALHHGLLPPSLHFESPNPQIDFAHSPFHVNAALRPWPTHNHPRRAGVSSFGIGGTNAHAILEEAPAQPPTDAPAAPWHLLVLSARTPSACAQSAANLATHFAETPTLNCADVAYTLQVGRRAFPQRAFVVCRDLADAQAALTQPDPPRLITHTAPDQPPPLAFLFSGQGAQYPNMGRELYDHLPVFHQTLDACLDSLRPLLTSDLRAALFPVASPAAARPAVSGVSGTPTQAEEAATQLQQTALTQPALFAIEYALAQQWLHWGIQPQALIGHSIGEYVAACLAGVFTLDDALALVAARGRLMQAMPPGAMLAVPLSEEALAPWLSAEIALAAVNTPTRCVLAGSFDALADLEARLSAQNIVSRRLHTSHAFHSHMLDPIIAPFTAQVAQCTLRPPRIPCISNVTGTWLTAEQATDATYWARHLRQPVRFAAGLRTLGQPEQLLLELGPGQTLTALAKQQPNRPTAQSAFASLPGPQDTQSSYAHLLTTAGHLWLHGRAPDWSAWQNDAQRRRTPLPTYPFERKRFWAEPLHATPPAPTASAAPAASAAPLVTPATPAPAEAPPVDSAVEALLTQQLALMAQQLDVYRSNLDA